MCGGDDDDDISVVHVKRRRKRAQSPPDTELLNGSTSSLPQLALSAAAPQTVPVRRSQRNRNPPDHFVATPASTTASFDDDDHDEDGEEHRLEQIDCQTPQALGLPPTHHASRLNVVMHPVAMALVSFHAHLTRTEVIGYLGGAIRRTPNATHVLVAEAFPAQALTDRALARSGRSAFTEVEIDPESSVEVIARLNAKGLQVVGWYHSHPDASFTVEPSRVDIENQLNYQQYMFKDQPFVAAIVAPYNEELPDYNPDVQFFHVHEQSIPVKIPYTVDVLGTADDLQQYAMKTDACFPNDAFVAESFNLISSYAQFAKRVRLDQHWRDGILRIDKLRNSLFDLCGHHDSDAQAVCEQKDIFLESVKCIMESVETSWQESADRDDERRSRGREARKRKRSRKR